ncbi:MAG: hypothetical protein J2P35_03905 [Actinobacteria bacterium]|nr:hypothetical protein [Actinomycetota bacterium]MBO0785889.1 hypothetical protein [Actinomycetota bacterium]
MHPMFVELFIQTDDEDLLAEEEARRRAARRAQRTRPPVRVRTVPREITAATGR